jgi:uncharacterized damage-inducible protein DinB
MIERVDRPEPPELAGELATLTGFLEFQRATFEWKCAGLSPEQLARRAVPPSTMSLLGLVRHLTDVERQWFRRVVGGAAVAPLYWSDGPGDPDFDDLDPAAAPDAWAAWRAEVDHARALVAGAPSLDAPAGPFRGHGPWSLRWVLVHMVEEYARHNGHADLLRERIDGAVGE